MKIKKELAELRKLSDSELAKELKTVQESLYKLRFQKVVDEMVDTSVIRKARKKIARVKTIQRERELAAASES